MKSVIKCEKYVIVWRADCSGCEIRPIDTKKVNLHEKYREHLTRLFFKNDVIAKFVNRDSIIK